MLDQIAAQLTRNIVADTWVTYLHELLDPNTGEFKPFYAGACRLCDVFASPDAQKNSAWKEYMNANPDAIYRIRVMNIEQTERFAASNILTLRKAFNPYCNAHGIFENRNSRVQCIETGIIYNSSAEACRALDLSSSALSNHLAGRTGFKTVKGYTFTRI